MSSLLEGNYWGRVVNLLSQLGAPALSSVSAPPITGNIPKISEEFVKGHPLEYLIRKSEPLDLIELTTAVRTVNAGVPIFPAGTVPAASNPATNYADHLWTRDVSLVAYALALDEQASEAMRLIRRLAWFYAHEAQRNKFIDFHFDPNPHLKYSGSDAAHLPPIRAKIDRERDGQIEVSPEPWGHNQLDAMGMWIWTTFRLANEGKVELKKLDDFLSEKVNPNNKIESIFVVAIKFLTRVQFWDQVDVGPWEDLRGRGRASSMGVCLAALREVKKFFGDAPAEKLSVAAKDNGAAFAAEIDRAIEQAELALEKRIPQDGLYAVETDEYPADAAITFLLSPFDPGLSREQMDTF